MLGCIIQARMGSDRLPGKVMMKADEKNTILYYVLSQLETSKFLKNIVVATTNLEEDEIIENFVHKMGFDSFRGSSNNVLDRYYQCAKKYSFSTIVRLTADNPLNDPKIIDIAIEKFNSNNFDFLTNSVPRTWPQGISIEIFSFNALETAWKNAKLSSEHEHVTPYFYNNKNKFTIFNMKYSKNISNLRWTIDRMDDLKLVRKIIKKIKQRPILIDEILSLHSKEPELFQINQNQIADEGYKKSLKDDKEFLK